MKKSVKTGLVLVLLFAAGCFLLFLSKSPALVADGSQSADDTYAAALEKRLEEMISRLGGVDGVKVMVTLERSDKSRASSYSREVIPALSGESSYELPAIRGVCVVCGGAENARIRKEIIELVSRTLNLSSGRIYVGN